MIKVIRALNAAMGTNIGNKHGLHPPWVGAHEKIEVQLIAVAGPFSYILNSMNETYSQPVDWVGQLHLGFVINAAFSKDNQRILSDWLAGLRQQAPEGLYAMTPEGLHITVLDWIAPLFAYSGVDKHELFKRLRPEYEQTFERITARIAPFSVTFTELRVTPGTIILTGQDDGQFSKLREAFTSSITLPEGAKAPPTIIHSSLARFVPPAVPLGPIMEYCAKHPLQIEQPIKAFRLIETRSEPMRDFTVLRSFDLTG